MTVSATQSDPRTIAVLHPAGDAWRALAVRLVDGVPRLLDARRFPCGATDEVTDWLERQGAGTVRTILPSAAVVCRTCTLPDAEDTHLHEALALRAESLLLGSAPAHRLAMAALPKASSETARTGLILAWPESATHRPPSLGHEIACVPDVAALAALLGDERPSEPVLWIDGHDGSIGLALSHASGVIFRAAHEDASTTDVFHDRIAALLTETALGASHTPSFVEGIVEDTRRSLADLEDDATGLLLPESLITRAARRVQGAPVDPGWWRAYGVAAGAILAQGDELAPLTTLREHPPLERTTPLERVGRAMADRGFALRLAVAAILILALGPLLSNGLRLGLLRLRHPDLDERYAQVVTQRDRYTVYQALEERAWPMSKLLADIVSCTPPSIQLDSIRIEQGQPFHVTGVALREGEQPAQVIIATMEQNLKDAGIFGEVRFTQDAPQTYGSREFDLQADILRPHHRPSYDRSLDYARWTLAQRQAGEGGADAPSEPGGPIANDQGFDDSRVEGPPPAYPGDLDRPRPPRIDRGDASTASRAGGDRGGGDAPPPSGRVPEPLSEDQIATMTREQVLKALSDVGAARRHTGRDEALKARLKLEFDLLMARLRELS